MIKWDETMSVGIGRMDQQHQRWLELINMLSDGIKNGQSQEVLDDLFAGALDYTKTHFGSEEELLAKNNYPRLNQQKQEHQYLIERMNHLKSQFESEAHRVTMELMNEMCNWLINHIKKSDKQYGQFLNVDRG